MVLWWFHCIVSWGIPCSIVRCNAFSRFFRYVLQFALKCVLLSPHFFISVYLAGSKVAPVLTLRFNPLPSLTRTFLDIAAQPFRLARLVRVMFFVFLLERFIVLNVWLRWLGLTLFVCPGVGGEIQSSVFTVGFLSLFLRTLDVGYWRLFLSSLEFFSSPTLAFLFLCAPCNARSVDTAFKTPFSSMVGACYGLLGGPSRKVRPSSTTDSYLFGLKKGVFHTFPSQSWLHQFYLAVC